MNFSPGFFAREVPLEPGGEARAAAAAQVRGLYLGDQIVGRGGERRAQPAPVAGADQHRLVEDARPLGLGRGPRFSGEHALERARPRVDDVALAEGRARVAEAEADGLVQRDRAVRRAHRHAETALELADLLVEACRPARGSGADAHDPLGRRLDEIVVEGRDAVDGRLGKPGHRRRVPAVVVGDLRRASAAASRRTSSAVTGPSPPPRRLSSSIRFCDIAERH